ncbi:MAG: IS110 family transposase [Flavisolibacter sp.]|nr:IS110 family transposase [Flavisolibacter sp.]
MGKVKAKPAKPKNVVEMPVVNPRAAGIDISDKEHVIAVPEGADEKRVRKFGTMSCDLQEIALWLQHCGITTVAMESTGVYWKPLFSVLVRNGFEVYLVNASHVKNVTGRKSDENDAMWIQKLHSCGLLKSSYLPDDEQEALRTLVRYRRALVQDSSRFVNRMQKSMELMNIKFHTVISDITGKSGKAVVEAILNGERNAENFLPYIDRRVKADRETIVKSLEGNWREEHLFMLKESYEMYQTYRLRIESCDREIEKHLQHYESLRKEGVMEEKKELQPNKKAKDKNHPRFNVRGYLQRIHSVDVLGIYGLSDIGGLELLAETGTDLSKWENENHFVSWFNLCPNNKISGGKLISSTLLKKKPNPASLALQRAANAVAKSNHWLGDYFRRMKAKGGNKYAVIATANKIARIYYKMVRYKQEFNPLALEVYQQKYKQAKIAYLERKLSQLKKDAA